MAQGATPATKNNPLDHNRLRYLGGAPYYRLCMSRARLERATPCLKGRCSTWLS